MKRKIVVNKETLDELKKMKTGAHTTYDNIIMALLENRMDDKIIERLREIQKDNVYENLNVTVDNIIVELADCLEKTKN
ncbi:MAG: hypothetical protein KAW47_09875 [Thermoplasmatales archaeon]|nr:hypothetical protein [Thermoplasmatales archaeon]